MPPGLRDLADGFTRPRLIFFMAWSDIRARYKRSVLGPLWITLSTAIGVVGLGFVWSSLFHMDRATYIPLLTIGLVLWQLLSGCIVEASSLLGRQANIIRNLALPLSIYPAQLVLRHVINFLHSVPLLIVVFLILGTPLSWATLLVLPNFLLVVLNLYWIVMLLCVLGARFRDFEYIVGMVMPLLMFFSPVMYRPNALSPAVGRLMHFNPLGDMIEIVRHPLLGEPTPAFLYVANILMLAVGWAVTLWLFNAKRNRIAFWV